MHFEVLNRSQLIDLVLDKHRQLTERYAREYREIKQLDAELSQQINREKQEQNERQERREVLKEKKKLLLYQAGKIQQQLLDLLLTTQSSDNKDALQQIQKTLLQKEAELNKVRDADTEAALINQIKAELDRIPVSGDVRSAVNLIHRKLDEMIAAQAELQALNENTAPGEAIDRRAQIKEVREKQRWLERRIDSHRQALVHWEQEKNREG